MPRAPRAAWCLAVLSLAAPGGDAWAQSVITVRADPIEAARRGLDERATSVNVVDLRARGFEVGSLAAMLDEVPGLHARSTGDALAPTAVSLRGAPATHVTVALDGAVLNDALTGSVDLSLVPPAILERAEVYRGSPPVRLGLAGLGGAIELRSRTASLRPFSQVGVGYGAFLQRRLFAAAGGSWRSVRAMISASYRGTRGDFSYYDDNGTPLDRRDDRREARRTNNEADALDVLARLCSGGVALEGCLLLTGFARSRGLPGPGARPLDDPSLTQSRLLARGTLRAAGRRGGFVELGLAAGTRADRFRDPRAEAGGARAVDTGAQHLELSTQGATSFSNVMLEPVARARLERIEAVTLDAHASRGATRGSLLMGVDARARWGRVEVHPSVGFEALLDVPTGVTGAEARTTSALLVSPRLAVRVALGDGLSLRASVAHLARAPTLVERYGVGTYLVGNPSLEPERALAGELGVRVQRAFAHQVSLRLDAVLFARDTQDMIVLVRSGAFALKALNLRAASAYGAELDARLSIGARLAVSIAYAHTQTLQRSPSSPADGRRVPATPANDLSVRIDSQLGLLRLSADLSFVDGIYLDERNLLAAPPRTLVGGSIACTLPFARAIELSLTLTNVLDQRDGLVTSPVGLGVSYPQAIADFVGYPLPGRGFFLAVTSRPR